MSERLKQQIVERLWDKAETGKFGQVSSIDASITDAGNWIGRIEYADGSYDLWEGMWSYSGEIDFLSCHGHMHQTNASQRRIRERHAQQLEDLRRVDIEETKRLMREQREATVADFEGHDRLLEPRET